jgi:hypothetical protein
MIFVPGVHCVGCLEFCACSAAHDLKPKCDCKSMGVDLLAYSEASRSNDNGMITCLAKDSVWTTCRPLNFAGSSRSWLRYLAYEETEIRVEVKDYSSAY